LENRKLSVCLCRELVQNLKEDKFFRITETRIYSTGVSEKNIRVEVGSAADPIQDRPIFYHLIEEELQEMICY
jgi:hypothetical protein